MGEHQQDRPEYMTLPFYWVVDVSGSMNDRGADGQCGIDGLNRAVPAMRDVLRRRYDVADVVKTSIITFASSAQVVLPLSDLTEASLPTFVGSGGTSYRAALELLGRTIDADIATLSGPNRGFYRPVVFFLSDGAPNSGEDWERAIPSGRYQPLIVPMGIGQVTEGALRKLCTPPDRSKLYIVPDGNGVADAITEMSEYFMRTVVTSAGGGGFVLPDPKALPSANNVVMYDYDGREIL